LYASSSAGRHIATLAVKLAAGHYLGLRAVLSSPAQLATVMEFVNSVSFPYPQCVGGLAHVRGPHPQASVPRVQAHHAP
ncbi:MAG: hypothetical protein M1435_03340, partial [Actinobacteria bacterium]|nr:hypothetical protein [Actinomycetota bacterium]